MSVPRFLALCFVGLVPAFAQDPAPRAPVPVIPPRPGVAPPGVPIPGVAEAPAGAAAVANLPPAQPNIPLGDNKITAPLEELKLNGDGLAGLYHKFTGRRVIVVTAAAAAEFRFIQDASPQDPLTYKEAADLLKKAAVIEGFVFVPDDENKNVDILTNATAGMNPKARGLQVFNESDILPDGDAVISYVMTLSYIKPADAVNAFSSIVGQFGTYGSIAAIPNASAVVITENTSLIRKLIDLKKEIDKPGSVQATRFIKVQYADVTEVATTLTDLLTAQQTAQSTAGIKRADGIPVPQGGSPQGTGQSNGGEGGGEQAPVQIIPDPRTNRIFAMGRPVDLVFVEGLIREFDVETSEKNFLRRKLKFLKVSDFLPIANDALTRAFTGTGTAAAGAGAAGGAAGGAPAGGSRTQNSTSRQPSSTSRSSASNTGSDTGSSGSSSFGSGTSSGSSSSGSAGDALTAPNESSAPESVLVGRTLLVADNITNSIVVQGPPSGLEIIERLLDQIDVKPDQVMISTIIGQLTLSDDSSIGVDYFRPHTSVLGHAGGGDFSPAIPIIRGLAGKPFNPGSLATGAGLQFYGRIGNSLDIYLEALKKNTDFSVLSRPSIFTANNQKGTISSGERIAIPTNSNSFTTGGASTNIEYQDVVLKLEVIPLVNSNNEITMQIALLSDEQNGTQVIEGAGANGTNLTVPRITTREVLTTVTVPNNEAVVLGGLIINKHNKDRSGIPILSDIPYLGALFSTRHDNKDRSELLVFMQPSIVNNDRSMEAVQSDIDARYKISEQAHTDSSGAGILPPLEAVTPVPDKGSVTTYESQTTYGKKTTRVIGPPHRR